MGPPGGDVRSLAADPRDPLVIYLGTADGLLYRSEDGGVRWRRLEPGFPLAGMSLDDLVVDPRGDVIVGYWQVQGKGGGVARSANGGKSFTAQPAMAGREVRALALAPSDPATLVAGTDDGVYRTTDGGESWLRISPPSHADLINLDSLAVDPRSAETIYAGTWHLAWKTTDAGRSWRSIKAGMIDDSDVMTLTLDTRNPDHVFATACSGIYRSPNAAGLWSKVRGIPSSSRRTRAFAQDPAQPTTLYAGTTEGLFVSEDDGRTWERRTTPTTVVNAVVPLPGGVVLLGTDGTGVLRSIDSGHTFAPANEGFFGHLVARTLFDPARGRVLVALRSDRVSGGVLTAPSPAGPWSVLASGLAGREVLSMTLSVQGVLAGTDEGLFLCPASGGAWRRIPTTVEGLDIRPRVTEVAVAEGEAILLATPGGLLRSTDGGTSWRRYVLGLGGGVEGLAVASRNRRIVLVVTSLGAFRSMDGGLVWEAASGPLSATARTHSLLFLPGDDAVAFAATSDGLYRTADQGFSWAPRGGGVPLVDITGLAAAADGRSVFVSAFVVGGLWQSADTGISWRPLGTAGLTTTRVLSLAVDPGDESRLLAAAAVGGLHVLGPTPREVVTTSGISH